MNFRSYEPAEAEAIAGLFRAAFAAADGEEEGALIGDLVENMMAGTDRADLFGFVAVEGARLVGAIFFSRIRFESDTVAFILSPVAVCSDQQGKGIGQALINHGLAEIRNGGAEYAITYGDPNYYSQVGFHPISQDDIAPPLKLSQPHGWLGQSLTGAAIARIPGRSRCVTALDNPAYW